MGRTKRVIEEEPIIEQSNPVVETLPTELGTQFDELEAKNDELINQVAILSKLPKSVVFNVYTLNAMKRGHRFAVTVTGDEFSCPGIVVQSKDAQYYEFNQKQSKKQKS